MRTVSPSRANRVVPYRYAMSPTSRILIGAPRFTLASPRRDSFSNQRVGVVARLEAEAFVMTDALRRAGTSFALNCQSQPPAKPGPCALAAGSSSCGTGDPSGFRRGHKLANIQVN